MKHMRKACEQDKCASQDRIAITAALNIVYELLHKQQQQQGYIDSMHERIMQLQSKVNQALNAVTS